MRKQKGTKNPFFGKRHTAEAKQKMRLASLGKVPSNETKKKMSENNSRYWLGKKRPLKTRQKLSIAQKKRFAENPVWNKGKKLGFTPSRAFKKGDSTIIGKNNNNWKGGITPLHMKIRTSLEYKLWREAVFKRDNYTCIWCEDNRGHNLNADHIKPFAHYPELRLALDNGRTLCEPCHKKTDTWGVKANKFKIQ